MFLILFTDINNALYRINMDDINIVQNVTLPHPSKISVDWVTGNVYLIEESIQITVCNFNIKMCAPIYTTDSTLKIDSLAIDPVSRYIYFFLLIISFISFLNILLINLLPV